MYGKQCISVTRDGPEVRNLVRNSGGKLGSLEGKPAGEGEGNSHFGAFHQGYASERFFYFLLSFLPTIFNLTGFLPL